MTSADEKAFSFQLPYELLMAATVGFSTEMCIGDGGSCRVYKAKLYNVDVAVKALMPMEGESEKKKKMEERQFCAEMHLLMVRR